MKLIDDWKLIAKKAWSARLMYVAAILSGIEAVLPFLADQFPRGLFAILSFVVVVAALISRFILQEKLHGES